MTAPNRDAEIEQLRREYQSAMEVVYLLVQRLGGRVEIPVDELISLDRRGTLVRFLDPAHDAMVLECRAPGEASDDR